MKKILAVSGGVDSMVLFDMIWKEAQKTNSLSDIIVAHFNHGTRKSADLDLGFVKKISLERGVQFESKKMHLGENVSEDEARRARYNFLNQLAEKYSEEGCPAQILVAHHLDDLMESIAINLIRGTGWRGLTPMSNNSLKRPFVEKGWKRADILKYAAKNNVNFRLDPTNSDERYLRNRVRAKLSSLSVETREKIYHETYILYQKQLKNRLEISEIIHPMIYSLDQYPREWFRKSSLLDESIQLELIREILKKAGVSATNPQMLDFIKSIREFKPEKSFNLPKGRLVKIHKTYFVL